MGPLTAIKILQAFASVISLTKQSVKCLNEMRPALDRAYERALKKWTKSKPLRDVYARKQYGTMELLADYITGRKAPDRSTAELLRYFEDELKADNKTHIIIQEILDREVLHVTNENLSATTDLRTVCETKFNAIERTLQDILHLSSSIATPYIKLEIYDKPTNYIDRTVSEIGQELSPWERYINPQAPHSLSWHIVNGCKYAILYSDAQLGKSTELKNLAYQLSDSQIFNPYKYNLNNYTSNSDLEDQIKIKERFARGSVDILILDGLDEIRDNDRSCAIKEINRIKCNYPELYIVISCRSNYMKTNRLDGFTAFSLDKLNLDKALEYIKENCKQSELMIREIKEQQYYEFIFNPFFLTECIEIFKKYGHLPRKKSDIYDYFIDKCFEIEQKKTDTSLSIKRRRYPLIEKIAFCIQISQRKQTTLDDLNSKLQISEDELNFCRSYPLFTCDKNGVVEFLHNSFREYMVAKYLSKQPFDRIKRLICYENSDIIISSMYNSAVLMVSIIENNTEKSQHIINWLMRTTENKQLLITCGIEMLDQKDRDRIFKEIFCDCKEKELWVENGMVENLMKFANTKESILFLLNELQQSTQCDTNAKNVFKLLRYADLSVLAPNEFDSGQSLILEYIDKHQNEIRLDVLCDVFNNRSLIVNGLTEKLFKISEDSQMYELLNSFLCVINQTNECDKYADWILRKADHINDCERGHCTISVSKQDLFDAFTNFNDPLNIIQAIKYLNTLYCDGHKSLFSDERTELIRLFIKLQSKMINNQALIDEIIEQVQSFRFRQFTAIYANGYRQVFDKIGLSDTLFATFWDTAKDAAAQWDDSMSSELKHQIGDTMDDAIAMVAVLLTDQRLDKILNDDSLEESVHNWLCRHLNNYECIDQLWTERIRTRFAHLNPLEKEESDQEKFDLLLNTTILRERINAICIEYNGQKVDYYELIKKCRYNFIIADLIWKNSDAEEKVIDAAKIDAIFSDEDAMSYFLINQLSGFSKKEVNVSEEQIELIIATITKLLDEANKHERIEVIVNVIVGYELEIGDELLMMLFTCCGHSVEFKTDEKQELKYFKSNYVFLDYLAHKLSNRDLLDNKIIEYTESEENLSAYIWSLFADYIVSYERRDMYKYFDVLLSKPKCDRKRLLSIMLQMGRDGIKMIKPMLGRLTDGELIWYYKELLLSGDRSLLINNEKQEIKNELENKYNDYGNDKVKEEVLRLLIHLKSTLGLSWCLQHARSNDDWATNELFPTLSGYDAGNFDIIKEYFEFAVTVKQGEYIRQSMLQSSTSALQEMAWESEKLRDKVVELFQVTAANDMQKYSYFYRVADDTYKKFFEQNAIEITLGQALTIYNRGNP